MRTKVIRRQLDGYLNDPPSAFPIGATWSMIALRRTDHLVLPLAGNRSIYCSWPPASFCEVCGAIDNEGYVGPVQGDTAHFPSVRLRCTCERCARQMLDLQPGELTGHQCLDRCTDRLHLVLVELQTIDAAPVVGAPGILPAGRGLAPAMTAALQNHPTATALRNCGWQIVDVTSPPRPWVDPDIPRLALWIEPVRPLPWESCDTAQDDPWVW